ncbi:hypothetical protein [Dactylosporangium sp. NPDC050588]|uniref:hypothetical protein n=1 Tax=Dactylosporangium sp. NPDC050588 TaxID=3157211 RepID=UPI0033D42EFA
MNADPQVNMVAFRLHPQGRVATGRARTRDDDALQQAWNTVRQETGATPADVTRVYSEWQPSAADSAFAAATFPGVELSWSFRRPAADGWEAAFADVARQIERALTKTRMEQTAKGAPPPLL